MMGMVQPQVQPVELYCFNFHLKMRTVFVVLCATLKSQDDAISALAKCMDTSLACAVNSTTENTNQPFIETKMTTVSANSANPFIEFGRMLNVDVSKRPSKEEAQKTVDEAGPVLIKEMQRLYPDGVINATGVIATWNDANLRAIANQGKITDAQGNLTSVSPEVRAAAQKILDMGGSRFINPNGDPWFAEADMLEAISQGLPDNSSFAESIKSLGLG